MACVERAALGLTGLPSFAVRDFGFLQLRMICEDIALGCLVAHGDITESNRRKFAREHSADRIMSMLHDLHPNFYPQP